MTSAKLEATCSLSGIRHLPAADLRFGTLHSKVEVIVVLSIRDETTQCLIDISIFLLSTDFAFFNSQATEFLFKDTVDKNTIDQF